MRMWASGGGEPPPQRVHGGVLEAALRTAGLAPQDVLDFSTNVNPYGPCPELIEAVRSAPIDRYPDTMAREACEMLASSLRTRSDNIALGNGASELLWTLARVLVQPGTVVAIVEPTFSEFRAAVELSGGRVVEWRARPAERFAIDVGAVATVLRDHAASVLFLCAPNTPTGVTLPAAAIATFAEVNRNVAVVLDQSFLSLSERFADAETRLPGNVICVRSLTKEHAIPGVRVGYLVAATPIVSRVNVCRPAWPTGAAAQAAAVTACRLTRFVKESRDRLLADRVRLTNLLAEIGLDPVPSTAGFVMVRTGNGRALRDRLLARHGILVRDCNSFGLPDYIRLAARPTGDCRRLAAALGEELSRC